MWSSRWNTVHDAIYDSGQIVWEEDDEHSETMDGRDALEVWRVSYEPMELDFQSWCEDDEFGEILDEEWKTIAAPWVLI